MFNGKLHNKRLKQLTSSEKSDLSHRLMMESVIYELVMSGLHTIKYLHVCAHHGMAALQVSEAALKETNR